MQAFKIKHKQTGLFSLGGMDFNLTWGAVGKTWVGMQALRLHLRQFKKEQVAQWEVLRISGEQCSGTVEATSLYEPKSKFVVKLSDTLKALLNYSRQTNLDTRWFSVRDYVLSQIYHPEMNSHDVLIVVTQAFEEARKIPELEMDGSAHDLVPMLQHPRMLAIRKSLHPSQLTHEFIVDAYLDFMINHLRFSKKSWCKAQLNP